MAKTIRSLLEEVEAKKLLLPGNYIDDEGKEHSSDENKFMVIENVPSIASFLEGNPIATDAVKATMDLIWNNSKEAAVSYLEKEHPELKDQIMTLIALQPDVAAKIASK